MLGKLIGGLIGGAPGSAIGAGLDMAEKRLTESVLNQVETHARPHLGPEAKLDLGTTLRLAHLAACLVVLEALATREAADAAMQRGRPPDTFVGRARLRLHARLASAGTPDLAEAAELRVALDALGTADLAAPRQTAPVLVRAAEDAAWADLSALLAGLTAPQDFEALFRGSATEGVGWTAGFLAFFRHHLGTSPKAETAFVAQSLALLRQADQRLDAALAALAPLVAVIAEDTRAIRAGETEGQRRLERLIIDASGGGAPAVTAIHDIRGWLRPANPQINDVPAEQLPTLLRRMQDDLRQPTHMAADLPTVVRRAIEPT